MGSSAFAPLGPSVDRSTVFYVQAVVEPKENLLAHDTSGPKQPLAQSDSQEAVDQAGAGPHTGAPGQARNPLLARIGWLGIELVVVFAGVYAAFLLDGYQVPRNST